LEFTGDGDGAGDIDDDVGLGVTEGVDVDADGVTPGDDDREPELVPLGDGDDEPAGDVGGTPVLVYEVPLAE